tara:strand:- start:5353 stop:5721 length:369 start_codon:yes stop_codon:yes gene_type:complete
MQSAGSILLERNVDFLRSLCGVKFVSLTILFAMTLCSLPALASAPKQTDPTVKGKGRAAAIASARVVKPFTMIASAQAATKSQNYGLTVLRRTTHRDCSNLLGVETEQGTAESCELRLIELQ